MAKQMEWQGTTTVLVEGHSMVAMSGVEAVEAVVTAVRGMVDPDQAPHHQTYRPSLQLATQASLAAVEGFAGQLGLGAAGVV